ncbi:MAG TPA: RagB/SusD family nutrient uptake outer membrane protein [Bacteroidales bacterium]|nr:RagB/SusD family nutrient uptake outer membrane protein [Bacteroidales bacterium]HOX77041.1 RagB/SusD family nutrient uptake outer membrane protein [Bacteroidales bacterium]HPI85326.1 RagB/SusD family nutrient uptake outer membrane protein [Bacteroidales bacterium]HPM93748.1 RagB/SusD family nutrient uptake outer membrane protein [Bacteroidales bacterium]
MKKSIIYPISIIVLVMLTIGCSKDFLDRQPLDREVSTNFYRTEADAMMALAAAYDALGWDQMPGVSWAPFCTVSDILSDDSYAGGADANDGMDENELNNFTIPTTNLLVKATWMKNYVGIYRANLLMEKMDQITMADEKKARMIAECKFLRAYYHFDLVRLFENIPLLTATIKGPSEYNQDQETPKEVYDQIALDLVEAAAVLPATIPADESGRVSKWAAQSLLGRVYLFYNGVYSADLVAGDMTIDRAKALEYLEDVITNSGHDLFPEYSTNFRLAGEYGIESVFEISHGDTPAWWDWNYVVGGEGNLAAQMQGPRVTNSSNWDRGWSFGVVSQKLVDDFGDDPRLAFTIVKEEELDGTLTKGFQHTGYYSRKYSSDAEHWGSDGQFELNRTCNFRVIRFSDVLLMAAELGSPNAQNYLDRVRSRVNLGSIPATPENIYRERRLELSLEGIRYFDVLRKGIAFASQEFTVVDVRGPKYTDEQVVYDHTFNSATKGFLPIPQTEIDMSAGVLKQNEGY